MNVNYFKISRRFIGTILLPFVLTIGGCAAPAIVDSVPAEFMALESSVLIEAESDFLSNVAGKRLKLLHDEVQASLVFNKDGTASGSLVRGDGNKVEMNLDWVWENASYCRAGTIGDSETERKCESVRLFPGVGILLTYIDTNDPEEYWLFE